MLVPYHDRMAYRCTCECCGLEWDENEVVKLTQGRPYCLRCGSQAGANGVFSGGKVEAAKQAAKSEAFHYFGEMVSMGAKTDSVLGTGKISQQAAEEFGLKLVIVHHRIGFIAVGEASLFLRVATPHRSEGFRASQWIVDELKKRVPIWKKPRFQAAEPRRASHRMAATV